ncbi:response regulator [Vibrio maerlii]|uniref:response regulator n=1 Tax=Vibrio maerlii TaxID=2231648 RepID=UPI000E3C518B|nr:response regulator [Vibrio maerlii]
MSNYLILCVDDERVVLDSVMQDIDDFEEHFSIEAAESVEEARGVISEYQQEGKPLALILCDHIMPQETGIDFLIELNDKPSTKTSRKILLTGQAGLEDTVQAVNKASLDFYISKPWSREELLKAMKEQLTSFIIENDSNPLAWISILDAERILKAAADKRVNFGD